ncbi:MAG: SCO family protein [Acidobacteriota bacterium]
MRLPSATRWLAGLTLLLSWSALGGQESAAPAAQYFTDTVLVDQDGREVRFYSDMLKGKVVVIDTIFTTCTGICPILSKTFARVQEHVGERLGQDVHLISISVDPHNDTPARLKEFAGRFGAKPGWHFLTGSEENVAFILQKLGQFVEDKESHKNIILIGNEPTGLWKKAFGLAPAEDLIKLVDSVLKDQGPKEKPDEK